MENNREKAIAEVEKDIYRREISLDTSNEVAMANQMIMYSASNLTLDEVKLLRFIIMQTKKGDQELYELELSAKNLAKVLDIKPKDLYKRLKTMTKHILAEVIEIEDKKAKKCAQFHWVDDCEYDNGIIKIKIAEKLKPFLIRLRGDFTRYELSEIIGLNSIYAIRIYEVIRRYMDDNDLPYADHSTEISISMEVLRKITNTEKKFERYSNFKTKVIDVAVREINRCSKYHVTAEPYKSGRAIVGFDFGVESQAGYAMRQQAADTDEIEGQMELDLQGMA